MTRRRLPLVALSVAVLVAVVAVVAHGRPLAARADQHGGLSASFWGYALTSLVIVVVLACLVGLFVVLQFRPDLREKRGSLAARTLPAMAMLIAIGFALVYAERRGLLHHVHNGQQPPPEPNGSGGASGGHGGSDRPGPHTVSFRWDEVVIVLGLLLLAGVIVVATRERREPRALPALAPEAVAAALDASLDDLRADPDLRRAIIAAYARMEWALAAAGVPRRPSEAPLEYLERALLGLHTSGPAVRRLTDLFEWARFSNHEPDPAMRDEAVDALEAVRDELRAPALVLA